MHILVDISHSRHADQRQEVARQNNLAVEVPMVIARRNDIAIATREVLQGNAWVTVIEDSSRVADVGKRRA